MAKTEWLQYGRSETQPKDINSMEHNILNGSWGAERQNNVLVHHTHTRTHIGHLNYGVKSPLVLFHSISLARFTGWLVHDDLLLSDCRIPQRVDSVRTWRWGVCGCICMRHGTQIAQFVAIKIFVNIYICRSIQLHTYLVPTAIYTHSTLVDIIIEEKRVLSHSQQSARWNIPWFFAAIKIHERQNRRMAPPSSWESVAAAADSKMWTRHRHRHGREFFDNKWTNRSNKNSMEWSNSLSSSYVCVCVWRWLHMD